MQYDYKGSLQHFQERAEDFRKSLSGFHLMKVNLCEAYDTTYRSMVILEYSVSELAKFPGKALGVI